MGNRESVLKNLSVDTPPELYWILFYELSFSIVQLEEKSRKIRSFGDSLMIMEEKLNATKQDKDELDNQVKSLKMLLNENNMKARDEVYYLRSLI